MKPRLVLIEWEDSSQAAPQWQWLSDIHGPHAVRCLSAGFLLNNGKQEKILAVSLGGSANGSPHEQASGIIAIPTRSVVRMTSLTAMKRKR